MKVKIELELPEADMVFRALKIIDPHTIFTGLLQKQIADAAKPAIEADKEKK